MYIEIGSNDDQKEDNNIKHDEATGREKIIVLNLNIYMYIFILFKVNEKYIFCNSFSSVKEHSLKEFSLFVCFFVKQSKYFILFFSK